MQSINCALYDLDQAKWSNEWKCKTASTIWPLLDQQKNSCVTTDHENIATKLNINSGHCLCGARARMLDLTLTEFFRSCLDEEEGKIISHQEN